MYSGTIVLKNKGKDIPDEVLSVFLDAHKSCFGIATVLDGALQVAQADTQVELNVLKETLEACKDSAALLYFGTFPAEGGSNDSIQPFVILNDANDNPVLAGAMSGDFSRFQEIKSAHSPHMFALNKYLKPKLGKMFMQLGNNPDRLLGELKDVVVHEELQQFAGKDGCLVMLANTGEVITISSVEQFQKNDWGTIYIPEVAEKEAEPEPEEKVETKPQGLFNRAKAIAKMSEKKAEAAPKAAPKVTSALKTEKPVEKALSETVETDTRITLKEEMVKPPANLNNKAKRKWYMSKIGSIPPNYKESPAVPVPVGKSFQDIKAVEPAKEDTVVAETARLEKEADKGSAVKSEDNKDVGTHHIPNKEPIALIPAKDRNDLVNKFLRKGTVMAAISEGREEILNPKAMQSLESKLPNFAEQLGMKSIRETYGWAFEDILEFCQKFPDSAAVLVKSLRDELLTIEQITRETEKETPSKASVPASGTKSPPKISSLLKKTA